MRRVDLDIYCALCAEKLSFLLLEVEASDDTIRCEMELDPHECCDEEEE